MLPFKGMHRNRTMFAHLKIAGLIGVAKHHRRSLCQDFDVLTYPGPCVAV